MDPNIIKIALGCLAAGAFLVLLFFLVKKYLKKRPAPESAEQFALALPPFESAMQALGLLEQTPQTDPRLFYFDLNLILRKYISRVFSVHAAEMTSQEFVRHTGTLDMDPALKTQIIRFQEFCDPIKYAGVYPENEKRQSDLSMVKNVISNIHAGQEKEADTRAGEDDV
jgi:hypothetical protein